jgi:hypothetical protein
VPSVEIAAIAPARACRGCGRIGLAPVLDLGEQPEAGHFPAADDPGPEPRWPLVVLRCPTCGLVQLDDAAPAEPSAPGPAPWAVSTTLRDHAAGFVDEALRRIGAIERPRIVEVASHGGHLRPLVAERGFDTLIVEANPIRAETAAAAGATVVNSHFDEAAAARLAVDGQANLILDNYLLAHVRRPDEVFAAIRALLAPDGWFGLEFDHLASLLASTQYDAFRHGHFSYLSLGTVADLAGRHGLEVVDASLQPVYGGAVRAWIRHAGRAASGTGAGPDWVQDPGSSGDRAVLDEERTAGLEDPATWDGFAARVATARRDLLDFLVARRAAGTLTVGYGAPSRGNTLLNASGVTTDLLPFTADASPAKQGRRLPGTGIPIVSPEALLEARPDTVLILTWDIAPEIVRQLSAVSDHGGRFVVPIPSVQVVG